MLDLRKVVKAIGELEEDKALKMINDIIGTKPSEAEVFSIIAACQEGMAIVGERFDQGKYFIGDLIFSGDLLTELIDIIKPALRSDSLSKSGTIVLGTVQGDLHDIGKNIFKSMAESVGFEVYDLGIDQPAEAFVYKVKEIKPDVLGMSGFLTMTIQSMKETVDALEMAGLRDSVKIIIGGNSVSEKICCEIGADAYTTNAIEGVKIIQAWMKERINLA